MPFNGIAMGITFVYQTSQPDSKLGNTTGVNFILPYLSISIALNILLTLMIVVRLLLHARNTRTMLGVTGISGFCMAVVTMLIESSALYTVSSLLVIGPWSARNPVTNFFLAILIQTQVRAFPRLRYSYRLPDLQTGQVIAPLLIIHRVVTKSAFTNKTIVSGQRSSFKARTGGEVTGGSSTLHGGEPTGSVDEHEMNSRKLGVETTTDFHQERV